MRLTAAAAIAVALPALLAGTATGVLLRPEPPPPSPRPRPVLARPEPEAVVPPPAPAPPPEETADQKLLDQLCHSPTLRMFLPADQIPKPVLDQVREQLRSGTTHQKLAILRRIEEAGWFGRDLPFPKEEVVERATAFLSDADPRMRAIAVPILLRLAPKQEDPRYDVLQELLRTSKDSEIRSTCIGSLGLMTSPEARSLLLQGAAQVASDPQALKDRRLSGATLGSLNTHSLSLPQDELASICSTALRNIPDPDLYGGWAEFAFRLPLPRTTTLLEQVRDGAPTPELQAGARRTLEQIRAGETRADRLQGVFRQAMK
jgi:hypothetical protein